MIEGFDFGLDTSGELIIDQDTSDILKQTDDNLRLQLAYDRIKSVSTNWFIDHIGANLESLIGRPCDVQHAEEGKSLIDTQLTFDKLWDDKEFYIKANINSNTSITYNILFKIYNKDSEETYSYIIEATIDLVKGVFIRYGWEPKYDSTKY